MCFHLCSLTGKSNSAAVSISHSRDRDGQTITCVLSGDENMTQINWEMLKGPNRTKLGTYHPHFGIYIMQEYETKVKIQNKKAPHPSSSLLIKVASNESVLICCAFITFPSGKLEQCADISKKDVRINTSMIKGKVYTCSPIHTLSFLWDSSFFVWFFFFGHRFYICGTRTKAGIIWTFGCNDHWNSSLPFYPDHPFLFMQKKQL